jgi:glutamate racemase
LLQRVTPGHVNIVDSAESTAQVVTARFHDLVLSSTQNSEERRAKARVKFFATDSTEKFQQLGQRFLGLPIEGVQHVDLKE